MDNKNETQSIIQKYRLFVAMVIFAFMTFVYVSWSNSSTFKEWFVNLYPELTGAILIYLLLSMENRFFFRGIKASIDKNALEQESQLVLKFWEKISDKQTDVYIGRNKDDQALSWTDLDAVDLFRKVLKNQQMLNLKHLNKLDETSNYIKTNIVSIGGPKRNNISKEILGKLKGISKYRFVNDEIDK